MIGRRSLLAFLAGALCRVGLGGAGRLEAAPAPAPTPPRAPRATDPGASAIANVVEFGADPTGIADSTLAIQRALDSGRRSVQFPEGFYLVTRPLVVPANSGIELRGTGAQKATHLTCFLPDEYAERGVIEYLPAPGDDNHAGLAVRNLHVVGNFSRCHGVRIARSSYVVLEDCAVEQFRGAGLLLDKVQDSSFARVSVQLCGRTTGDPEREADTTDNGKTAYAAVTLDSTVDGDHCNMLRFTDMQVENNLVSPYVWIRDTGGIGIVWSNLHAEARERAQWGKYDLFQIDGGDFQFTGVAAAKFRTGFVFRGYGHSQFVNCRELGGVRHERSGVDGSFAMVNCQVDALEWTGLGGRSTFVGCRIGDVTIRYPGQGPSFFASCTLGSVRVSHAGAGDAGVRFHGCVLDAYHADADARGQYLLDCVVTGELRAAAGGGSVVRSFGAAPPASAADGEWCRGAVVWNTDPSPGGHVGWVCVASGTPGEWRPFGAIG